MLGAGIYPITIAEMGDYMVDADQHFDHDEHERLKSFLALHPECGDVIPATNGVRLLYWPIKKSEQQPRVRVVYYFRDLNMPLYLLALYKKGERIPLAEQSKREIRDCVDELITQHSESWARVIRQQQGELA